MRTIYFKRVTTTGNLKIDSKRIDEIGKDGTGLDELHVTTFYELFFFNQVEGELETGGRKLPLHGPTAVLFPPLEARKWKMTYGEDSFLIFFEAAFLDEFLRDPAFLHRLHFFSCHLRVPVLPLSNEQTMLINAGIQAIRQELQTPQPDSVALLRSNLYQLLLHFNRFYNSYHQLDPNLFIHSDIIQFKTLLKQHIQHIQSVQEYADLMGMSRNRMNELCVKVFGKQAHLLIRDELIQACKTDLLNTSLTVAEISYKYDFSAPPNFTRFFKTYEGLSPAAYRVQFGQ